ncbi:Aldo/keto reductase [Lasiodiplodia theobromae]|nr:Aldo/keto reductase [Lasiodiplodia theobromae]
MRDDRLEVFFDVLHKFDIRNIDTVCIYKDSEKRLGEISAGSSFIIDAKAPAFSLKAHSKNFFASGLNTCLRLLKTDKVDVYHLHASDLTTLIEETVDTIQEMYRHGKFGRFDLSN